MAESLRDLLSYEPVELSFGTSGLRALVKDMTDLECYINTLGFLNFLKNEDSLKAGETVYLAGDLRESTPRISAAVCQAIRDSDLKAIYCGLIPTPAVAYYALMYQSPAIMVTGSHIPADRNGIKFYKQAGEILKPDEAGIKAAVAIVRQEIYDRPAKGNQFDSNGNLQHPPDLPEVVPEAASMYIKRYVDVFGVRALVGKQLVFYQHSAVGRDLLVDLLQKLGAEVKSVGRSDTFIPIDSENVTTENQTYFRQLATENQGCFAIVSTDGDSDRPFVVDEHGLFHRGDVLGAVSANWLESDFAAYPVSSSDAVDSFLTDKKVALEHTKIGSPYVVAAMQAAEQAGHQRVVGWEVNGGFMTEQVMQVGHGELAALPTRDAILPIIIALLAASDKDLAVSQLFAGLPARYTQAGLIDNFPGEAYMRIAERFTDADGSRAQLTRYFGSSDGFGEIIAINRLDGIRITFSNGDIAHLRQSGNAPQLRIYSVADSQKRADQIVQLALAEPKGILRRLQADV